ncbi:MAG: von Willebrand factor type A domain-containing protein [Luteolibacter sp.]|jgi:Mg-chelatase subunit ChlD|nr:von Willebrand factor type A domain-containing protein [Luteolibacter sp.]
MSDTPFTTIGDEPVEARIVAWVLGEASAFEAAELERLCEERPELLVFRRRMRALHGLLTEAEGAQPDDGWKLPPEKRKVLDDIFGEEQPVRLEEQKEIRIRRGGRRAFLAIAACLILTVIIAGLLAPMVVRQRKKADLIETGSLARQNELAAAESSDSISEGRMQRLETTFPPELIEGTPKPIILPGLETPVDGAADGSSLPANKDQVMAQAEQSAKFDEDSFAGNNVAGPVEELAKQEGAVSSGSLGARRRVAGMVLGDDDADQLARNESGRFFAEASSAPAPARKPAVRDETATRGAAGGGVATKNQTAPSSGSERALDPVVGDSSGIAMERLQPAEKKLEEQTQAAAVAQPLLMAKAARAEDELLEAGESMALQYESDIQHNAPAPAEESAIKQNKAETSLFGGELQYPMEPASSILPDSSSAAIPLTPAAPMAPLGRLEVAQSKPATPEIDLAKLMEEISATEDPYSTFSLNISDASFQIAQAALAKGEQPDPAGIKVEQFYNAVDYGDPAPSAGEPVAVAIEQSAHPVIPGRNLVRVALKTAAAGRSASQALRLTLLVDQSGSMVREDRRAAMENALAGLAGLLTEKDSVSVVGFSRTPRLLADSMPGNQANKLAELVNQSASEGGTNLEEAIQLAEQMADRNQLAGAQNRIVLFTDGAANLGNADPLRLAERVKVLRQKGISFDIAGIAADGLNDELLGELARNGNGRYYVVGKGADDNFAKQLAGAFRPAAENVKVQVHFNPERVGRYKLIGFEKDRLKTEDFRNDAVDAAELAAEEAGVAIYQVEPLPGGNGELGEVSVRFRDAASAQMVERTWTIPHDSSAPAIDRATPSMQLAVLSMLAAEKLKGGPLADAIDFQQLADPCANVKGFYGNTGRVGEMLRMLDALK